MLGFFLEIVSYSFNLWVRHPKSSLYSPRTWRMFVYIRIRISSTSSVLHDLNVKHLLQATYKTMVCYALNQFSFLRTKLWRAQKDMCRSFGSNALDIIANWFLKANSHCFNVYWWEIPLTNHGSIANGNFLSSKKGLEYTT